MLLIKAPSARPVFTISRVFPQIAHLGESGGHTARIAEQDLGDGSTNKQESHTCRGNALTLK